MRTQRKHFVKVKGEDGVGGEGGGGGQEKMHNTLKLASITNIYCSVGTRYPCTKDPPPQNITLAVLLRTHCNQTWYFMRLSNITELFSELWHYCGPASPPPSLPPTLPSPTTTLLSRTRPLAEPKPGATHGPRDTKEILCGWCQSSDLHPFSFLNCKSSMPPLSHISPWSKQGFTGLSNMDAQQKTGKKATRSSTYRLPMCFGVNMKPGKRWPTTLIGKGNRSHLMVVYKIT